MTTAAETDDAAFLEWEQRASNHVYKLLDYCGLSDLPECPIREWFAAGVAPEVAALRAIRVMYRQVRRGEF